MMWLYLYRAIDVFVVAAGSWAMGALLSMFVRNWLEREQEGKPNWSSLHAKFVAVGIVLFWIRLAGIIMDSHDDPKTGTPPMHVQVKAHLEEPEK